MRLLFITSTRLGDAVLSSGVLAGALRRLPGARVTVACGPAAAPLFEAVPGLERIVVMNKQPFGLHWLDLWRRCAGRTWAEAIDLRRSAVTWFLAARRRRTLGPSDPGGHKLEQLAEGLGLDAVPEPELWTGEMHETEAARILGSAGPPVLAVAPVANWRGKEWRAERFVELLVRLTGRGGILPGARVVVLGGPGERVAAGPVIRSIPEARCIDLVGGPHILTVFALLRRAALFVGNDSGLMHLAAASGAPTLGLFGPSRVEHYAPWGPLTAVARTPESYEELVDRPDYDHRTTGSLMGGLTVDMVEQAARSLWARCEKARA